jgi:ubiquinone/menaquinone biosynthesis C-methylase UbiE
VCNASATAATEAVNLFDRMRPAYQKWAEPVSRAFARTVLECTDLNPGARVLDVCAGTGSLALQAARIGLQVTAIDNAPVTTAHLAEQLLPYPGCTAEVMNALQMRWNEGQFEAAFSIFGVMFFGPEVPTVLANMRRAVRPGGVVAVVHWATPRGAPHFDILAQASRGLDDPEIGTLEAVMPGYVSSEALREALLTAGLVDVHAAPLQTAGAIPASESFLTELETFFAGVAGFGNLTIGERERLNTAIVDAIRPIEEGNAPRPGFHANLALGHVPTED